MTDTTVSRLLTSTEVARILNISRPFAYKLMRGGIIPSVRMGKAVRVRPEDLDKFVNAHTRDELSGWSTDNSRSVTPESPNLTVESTEAQDEAG